MATLNRSSRWRLPAVAIAVIALVAAACGSSASPPAGRFLGRVRSGARR